MNIDTNNLLEKETEQLKKLREIVQKAIEDENLIIENLLNPPNEILSKGQKISDKVARFGGSWRLLYHSLLF